MEFIERHIWLSSNKRFDAENVAYFPSVFNVTINKQEHANFDKIKRKTIQANMTAVTI